MSRLRWIERGHGWRAGPYEIELAAPQLWVCTRRRRDGSVEVMLTSGSLSALKKSVEKRDSRRRNLRRALGYLAVFLVGMALAAGAAITQWPLFVLVFSSVAVFAGLKTVDCLVQRSWESLRLHYQ